MKISDKRGFSFWEVIIIVFLAVAITAVLMPKYKQAVEKTKVAEAVLVTRAIADANRMYNLKNGNYTADLNKLDVQLSGNVSLSNSGKTDLFSYSAGLKGDDKVIAVGERLPEGSSYSLVIDSDKDGIGCVPYNKAGQEFCRNMGRDYYMVK